MIESAFDFSLHLIATPQKQTKHFPIPNDMFTHIDYIGIKMPSSFSELDDDLWVVKESYRDAVKFENSIVHFFESHIGLLQEMNRIKNHFAFRFRIAIVSEFAQIGFTLSQQDLIILKELNIPIEISLFSWGKCIDSLE